MNGLNRILKARLALGLALYTISSSPILVADAQSDGKSLRMIEILGWSESSQLPPQIMVNFDIHCNQRFVGILRNEEISKASAPATTIALAVLVEEDARSTCDGVPQKMSVTAGSSYSGRSYKIVPIRK